MENYIPKIHENGRYVEILIEAEKCVCCEKIMIAKSTNHNSIFPKFWRINQESQMKAAGIVYKTHSTIDGYSICIECEQAGKSSFLCALCNERKSSDKRKEAIGDPADFLCKDCFETKSAKVWEEKYDELIEEHKYDFL